MGGKAETDVPSERFMLRMQDDAADDVAGSGTSAGGNDMAESRAITAEHPIEEREETARTVMGGSAVESLGGVGAMVLAILALVGVLPFYLAAIATIAAGGGLLVQGSAIATRYSDLRFETATKEPAQVAELVGGVSLETLGGIAGVALGILALVGVAPMALVSVAVLVFGGTLIMGAGTLARLNNAVLRTWSGSEEHHSIAREAVRSAAATQVMVGIGAITLGILALSGVNPLTLSQVALIAIGASILFGGSSAAGRMTNLLG
ncbi:MAG: hypothetical protein P8099_00310 [Gemmatimonadota bacterium]|jgi:hypothetical protein